MRTASREWDDSGNGGPTASRKQGDSGSGGSQQVRKSVIGEVRNLSLRNLDPGTIEIIPFYKCHIWFPDSLS